MVLAIADGLNNREKTCLTRQDKVGNSKKNEYSGVSVHLFFHIVILFFIRIMIGYLYHSVVVILVIVK